MDHVRGMDGTMDHATDTAADADAAAASKDGWWIQNGEEKVIDDDDDADASAFMSEREGDLARRGPFACHDRKMGNGTPLKNILGWTDGDGPPLLQMALTRRDLVARRT